MQFLKRKAGDKIVLPAPEGAAEQVHVFSEDEILAVNTALAARRALLVRGDPGTGKTQLASAVAVALKRAFVPFVVDSRTEARDLQWHFDAIARLADAQVEEKSVAIEKYIYPRPLWWAFDWKGAEEQAERAGDSAPPIFDGCRYANGVVVLIDEIDKAEADVPNGLLEALGAGEFKPHGMKKKVKATGVPPLVIVTTNEERSLPNAFERRCLALHLRLPEGRDELVARLVERGRAHFPDVDTEILKGAAGLLFEDRQKAVREHWRPYPGQAEFMDLVRAVLNLAPRSAKSQIAEMNRVAGFVLRKHPGWVS